MQLCQVFANQVTFEHNIRELVYAMQVNVLVVHSLHVNISMQMLCMYLIIVLVFVGYLRKANKVMTTVDRVFGGRLVNTIVCHKCSDVCKK